MKLGKLGLFIFLSLILGIQSCGDDEDEKTAPCMSQNCDNPQSPAQNIIGTWRVYEDDEDYTDREFVVFNADGTGIADESNNFSLFWGNTGETITDFDWEWQEADEWYLVNFGFAGRFYTIIELDCDYMKVEDNSTLTNTGEKLKFILCREN